MSTPRTMSRTLRALARLLSYPDSELRLYLGELREALRGEAVLRPARLAEVEALIDAIGAQSALDAEADYVQLFDSGRRTSLHLFEHVHGDSRDRGPALVDLARTFESAGLHLAEGEMPDYLPVVLEYASTQPPREARAFLAEMAHILNVVHSALSKRRSRYASLLGALIELAGEEVAPVDVPEEESVDATWAEPAAFDGCSVAGQSRRDQPQPIRIHRKTAASAAPGVRP